MTSPTALLDTVGGLFAWVARASTHTAVVIVLVLLVQTVMGRRLGPRARYALWGLVIARALVPTMPQSDWSVFNVITPPSIAATARPEAGGALAPAPASDAVVFVHVEPGQLVASPSSPPVEAARSTRRPSNYASLVWIAGVVVFAAAVAVSSLRFARVLRRSPRVTDARVVSILDRCRRELGLRSVPHVLVVTGISGPALTGVWRPRVVVPPGLVERLDDDELHLVLAHELAHLRRRDLLVEWLLVLVRTVHWFNPLVWYAVARCRADRELACDASVLRRCMGDGAATDRAAYGRTILKLAHGLPLAAPAGAVGIVEGRRGQLKRRIRMIATATSDRPRAAWSAVAVVVVLVLGSCTMTDPRPAPTPPATAAATPADESPDEFGRVARAYDVRDVIVEVPDFVDAPSYFERPGSASTDAPSLPVTRPDPAPTRAQRIAEIIRLVKDTVAPESWDKSGGPVLRDHDGQFIVTAPPAVHDGLARVLTMLRETRSAQVTIESRFLALDDAEMAALTGEMADIFNGDVKPDAPGRPSNGAAAFLDDAQVAAVLRAGQDSRDSTTVTAPRITLFNGQRAYVLVGTQRAYVRSIRVTKAADGATNYEPDVGIANSGVILDARATASADRKSVTLSLRPQISTLVAMREERYADGPPGQDLHVQIPDVETSEIATTVTVPDGQTVLLRGLRGGMALRQADADAAAAAGKIRNVVLLVKAKLVQQPVEPVVGMPASASPANP